MGSRINRDEVSKSNHVILTLEHIPCKSQKLTSSHNQRRASTPCDHSATVMALQRANASPIYILLYPFQILDYFSFSRYIVYSITSLITGDLDFLSHPYPNVRMSWIVSVLSFRLQLAWSIWKTSIADFSLLQLSFVKAAATLSLLQISDFRGRRCPAAPRTTNSRDGYKSQLPLHTVS